MLDTAAVALAVLRREPSSTVQAYARELMLDDESALRFIAAHAGFHDLGKATPIFQSQWEPGKALAEAAGFRFPRGKTVWVPHAALTEALAARLLIERGLKPRVARTLARCLGGHHGFLATSTELSLAQMPDSFGLGLWDEARRALTDCLLRTVGVHQMPNVERLGEATALAIMAVASFSDWIASDMDYFPYGCDAADPEAYWHEALEHAERALRAVGWRPRRPLAAEPVPFQKAFPFSPNDLQKAVAEAVSGASEPVLLIVEAPMGMGKTEAALYAHLELQRTLGHRGLYLALPTMATGNGMFPRVKEWLQRLGHGDEPVDLQLQHGTAFLQPDYVAIRPRSIGDDRSERERQQEQGQGQKKGSRSPAVEGEGAVIAAAWFSQTKRAMLSEYGVGTVDQALLGVLRVRHHAVRLWGLANRTVVLDEVHAYDAYTSGLIEALVGWLKTLGSSVILMSATLTHSRRRELVRSYGGELPIPEHPYPRLTLVRGDHVESVPVRSETPRTLFVESAPPPVERLAPVVLKTVQGGGCAACIVNTVERAQRLYQALGEGVLLRQDGVVVGKQVEDTHVYLVHARYPAQERQAREQALLRLFGKGGYREGLRPERAIVVATQVLEQSLDLDFDVMFTDLAPVDLLLQRAGRLHRFDLAELSRDFQMALERPAPHAEARLFVAGLSDNPPDLGAEHWDAVYSRYVLLMSWWALRGLAQVRLPADIEELVENVYERGIPGDLPAGLREAFEEARREFEHRLDSQKRWALRAAITEPGQLLAEVVTDVVGQFHVDDDEENPASQVPLTRLGDPTVGVVLLHRVGGGLYLDPEGRVAAPVEGRLSDDQARLLFLRSVRLGHRAVYEALIAEKPPAAWQKHPLLRQMRAIELENGIARKGGVRIRLDPELGVVYES